jgi:hypothetical protein
LIKRSAYGFRNFDNYRIRCLLNWHFNYWIGIVSTEEPQMLAFLRQAVDRGYQVVEAIYVPSS